MYLHLNTDDIIHVIEFWINTGKIVMQNFKAFVFIILYVILLMNI